MKFFLTYSTPPRLSIIILGYYSESNSNGDTSNVTDFRIEMDMARYMPGWDKMAVVPYYSSNQKTFEVLLQEYVSNRSSIKQIHMTKQPIWDYKQITHMIHGLIRSTGYSSQISITFPVLKNHCYVYSPSLLSRISHHVGVNFIAWITCTWIIFYPMVLLYIYLVKLSNIFSMVVLFIQT